MIKMSKSNFGKYFRYKLAQNKPVIFIYALLNFLTVVVPQIMIYKCLKINDSYGIYIASENISNIMGLSIIVCVIVMTVTTVKSMRIYHDRAAMDTLGCLPLSYGERFWGDLLGGMCANFISLVPFFFIAMILKGSVDNLLQTILIDVSDIENEMLTYGASQMHTLLILALIVIISYIGVYAFTTFISSCCGKFGTSVLFSFVAMAVLPGVYWVYANYFFSNAVGADPFWEICSKIGLLPPFGWVISIVMRKIDPYISYHEAHSFDYLINRPICFIVPILMIAAILLGAYLIGKRRKAEKTGEGFVFKSVFYVLVMTLLMLVVGLTSFKTSDGDNSSLSWYVILPLGFLLYTALEVSQNNGFKGFWKTVLRFAAVVGVSVAFMTVIKVTNSFGYYKTLPSESSIKEVRVAGDYFYSDESFNINYHTYKSNESISTILGEHKKLLETDGLKTGHKLIIAYTTKDGGEVHRGYTVEDKENDLPIRNFSDTVNGLQEFDPSVLGVLGGSDFSEWIVEYDPDDIDKDMYIRKEKVAELAEILSNDIRNYYFDTRFTRENTVGVLRFRGSGEYYLILDVYEATLEFLNDPSNYEDMIEASAIEYFNVTYRTKEEGMLSEISVTVSTSDTSEHAKELLSYIVPTHNINYTLPYFTIEDSNRDGMYKITDDKAAVKAMLELLRENNS